MGGAEGRHMAQFERVLLRLSYVDAVRSGQNSHEFRVVIRQRTSVIVSVTQRSCRLDLDMDNHSVLLGKCTGVCSRVSFSTVSESMTGFLHFPAWNLLLPLTWTPDRRDQRLLVSLPKDTGSCPNIETEEVESNHRPVD